MESAGFAHRTTPPPPSGAIGTPPAERPLRPREAPHPPRPATPPDDATTESHSVLQTARDYFALTKPRIISLLLWTTVMTMIVAKPSGLALSTVLWTCLGGYLSAGGAGAINHFIDRKIDARMSRTSSRPIVEGRIEPCLLYTSPSPRDGLLSRMPSSA